MITKIALSASQTKFVTTAHGQHNRTLDQVLLPELDRILSTANIEPKFIVMHLMGAHFKYKNVTTLSLDTTRSDAIFGLTILAFFPSRSLSETPRASAQPPHM